MSTEEPAIGVGNLEGIKAIQLERPWFAAPIGSEQDIEAFMAYEMPITEIVKGQSLTEVLKPEKVEFPCFDTTFTTVTTERYEPVAHIESALRGIRIEPKIPKKELLTILQENYERHKVIVEEAKAGYLKEALEQAQKAIGALQEGRLVTLAEYSERPPMDYSKAYEHAIRALELTTEEIIEMTMGEFAKLVMDEWDWQQEFLRSSSDYSASGRAYFVSKY